MKPYILLFSFLLCSAFLFAQGHPDTLRRMDADGWLFMQVRTYNNVQTEGNLHNGVKEGIWIDYWPSTYPAVITVFNHGKIEGTKMGFNVEGKTEYVENYRNGKLEGPRKIYGTEHAGLLESSLHADGQKHGPYAKWHDNGKKAEDGNYVDGKRDGKNIWYDDKGNRLVEYTYDKGVMVGDAATYYPSGSVKENGIYTDNKQTGVWKEYYNNGKLKAEGKYTDGLKEGQWKQFDENGNAAASVSYKKGEVKK